MKPNYKFLSFFYDIIDVFFFNRKSRSPRTALINQIPYNSVHILDVCAGTCSNSILIAKSKPQAKITALDLSSEMLKIAEKKFQKQGIHNIEVFAADACNTGLPDNSFDIIILSLVLHEVSDNLRHAILKEVKRILTAHGQVVIMEWEQPIKLFQRIMFLPIKLLEPRGFKEFLNRDLERYFHEEGFSIKEQYRCDYTKVIILS